MWPGLSEHLILGGITYRNLLLRITKVLRIEQHKKHGVPAYLHTAFGHLIAGMIIASLKDGEVRTIPPFPAATAFLPAPRSCSGPFRHYSADNTAFP